MIYKTSKLWLILKNGRTMDSETICSVYSDLELAISDMEAHKMESEKMISDQDTVPRYPDSFIISALSDYMDDLLEEVKENSYDNGYHSGHSEGYDNGYEEGRREGYEEGQNSASE